MKPSEIIDKALTEVIPDETKWCQLARHNLFDQHCLLGAMDIAAGRMENGAYIRVPNEYLWARSAVLSAIEEQYGSPTLVTAFNDQLGRTYDEVRMVMEKARAGLQEKGM